MKNRTQQKKMNSLFGIGLLLVILTLVNIGGRFYFFRVDLTGDHRYSLHPATQKQLEELNDIAFFRVYLDGDLPAGFQRLRNSIMETLQEMTVYGGDNIQFELINPTESGDPKKIQEIYRELSEQGLKYTNLFATEGEVNTEQVIFPGAILSYNEREYPIQFLRSNIGSTPEEMLNNSIQQVEFELSSAIRKATNRIKSPIGILTGDGYTPPIYLQSLIQNLLEFYTVDTLSIDGKVDALDRYEAIIIPGPIKSVPPKDKYLLDQFIMHGGKTLWFVDGVEVRKDSLFTLGTTLSLANDVDLTDMLFKYGVRVNSDLIMDLQSLPIPVVTGMMGDQPRQDMFPWFYFPLQFSLDNHPINQDLDAVATQFVSSLDTLKNDISKTPLLMSSEKSKLVNAPTRVSLNILRFPPDERQYSKGRIINGVLLEGEFESAFKNRISPEISENPVFNYKEKSEPNKMIVFSSSSIVKNEVDTLRQKYFDLGYYKYTRTVYANKELVMNAVNFLMDDSGLINARSKKFKIRLLDRPEITKNRRFLQTVNTVFPVVLISLITLLAVLLRRKRYRIS